MLRLPAASIAAVLGGLLLYGAFPPLGWGLLAVPGVALITAALWGARLRRGVGLGLVSGWAFFGPLLAWMHIIGVDAWLALSLLYAAWIALVGVGITLVTRLPGAPVWVAAVWVLGEALRGRIPLGGFPWGNLSFAEPGTALGSWAAWGGAPFLTFLVALAGAALVEVVRAAGARRRRALTSWSVVVLAIVAVPMLLPLGALGDEVGGPPSARIAIVQGGTPQTGMGAMDVRRAVLDNHVRVTMDLAKAVADGQARQPEFVLWPENSSDLDPFADAEAAAAITAAARAVGAPILVGAVTSVPGNPAGVWNVGIVWDPESGPTDMYVKTHPVPFGEYIPFRAQLASLIGRFDRIPRDFIPGDQPGNLDIGGVAVGNVICFEIAYAEVVDAVVDGGARVITVQTNNATYGGTAQPDQQLGIERIRAIETGRSVLVAATSGVSAQIAADGSLTQVLEQGQTGWIDADVALRGALTPASRIGHVVEFLLCLLAVIGIAFGARAMYRERRRSRIA